MNRRDALKTLVAVPSSGIARDDDAGKVHADMAALAQSIRAFAAARAEMNAGFARIIESARA